MTRQPALTALLVCIATLIHTFDLRDLAIQLSGHDDAGIDRANDEIEALEKQARFAALDANLGLYPLLWR